MEMREKAQKHAKKMAEGVGWFGVFVVAIGLAAFSSGVVTILEQGEKLLKKKREKATA